MSHPPSIPTVEAFADRTSADCYQCGKCSAGCPVAAAHGHACPTAAAAGAIGPASSGHWRAAAIWQCVSCMTCTARCPKSVDCAGVMDALRQMLVRSAACRPGAAPHRALPAGLSPEHPPQRPAARVGTHRRVQDQGVPGDGSLPLLLKDALLAPQVMRGASCISAAQRVKDRGVVQRIFDRCSVFRAIETPVNGTSNRWKSATIPAVPCTARRTTTRRRSARAWRLGRRPARAGRLDLLRGHGRPLAQSQAGRGPAGPQPGPGPARRPDELLAPCPMCSMELHRASRALAGVRQLRREIPRSSSGRSTAAPGC